MSITVSALFYSPIKSAGGARLSAQGQGVEVTPRGFKHDRQYVVVEGDMFVAQRRDSLPLPLPGLVKDALSPLRLGIEVRRLCQVTPRVSGKELIVSAPDMALLRLPIDGFPGKEETITLWRDCKLKAVDQGREASLWFTKFLSRERPGYYRLMRMADTCRWQSKGGSALQGFHDGFPFMMISDASLGNLNDLLLGKGSLCVEANRFRPNIWLRGCEPHQEDHFSLIRIGEVVFEGKKLCDRCVVTCTEQHTALRGKEPLATLVAYRLGKHLGIEGDAENKVFFGRNFDHQNTGIIRVGDEVEVLRLD